MSLHSCVPSVSLVTQIRAGNAIGSATAFFYKRGDKLFLVTNSHVCRNDRDGVIPDLLRLKVPVHACSAVAAGAPYHEGS
jgi:hypothetical protein